MRWFGTGFPASEQVADRVHQLPNLRGENAADRSDPERVYLGQFARVNDEPAFAKAAVKLIEGKPWVCRERKCSDNKALQARGKIGVQLQLGHAVTKHRVIGLISSAAPRDSALRIKFLQCLVKPEQGLIGRGIANLAGEFQTF